MKTCTRCHQEKDDSEFYLRKNRSNHCTSMCKKCTLEYMKDKRDLLVQLIIAYKTEKKCAKCGEDRYYMLEFHHNDPSTKEFNISHHMRKTFKNLLPEISKCSVLCANCHKEYHYLNNISGITTEEYLKSSK